jgi:hypothetical protein
LTVGVVVQVPELVTSLGPALAWPAVYGAIFVAVLLCLLVSAATVAMVAQDDKRANRAFKIFSEILRFFRRRSK